MTKVKCEGCKKEINKEIYCPECMGKQYIEYEDQIIGRCDNCNKDLRQMGKHEEISLFYKWEADYTFCSKKCLIEFANKLK